jgi:hypothetical protein
MQAKLVHVDEDLLGLSREKDTKKIGEGIVGPDPRQ